jgi:hypothetical protein
MPSFQLAFLILALLCVLALAAEWTNPKDALINPRGQKVCMEQCGTSELRCPEAFVSYQSENLVIIVMDAYRFDSINNKLVLVINVVVRGERRS